MKYLDKLLEGRSEQERRTLLVGLAIAAVLFVWLLIWQPLLQSSAAAQQRLEQKRQAYQWMVGAAAQIRALAPRGAREVVASPQQLITSAGREQGVSISRIEPQSGGRYSVWVASTDYNAAVKFVDVLTQGGLRVESATFSRLEVPGTVSLRLILGGSE